MKKPLPAAAAMTAAIIGLGTAAVSSARAAQRDSSGIDLSGVPAAHSAEEANARFDRVAQLVIAQQSSGPVGVFENNGLGFTTVALAKLAAGVDVDEINRVLVDPASTAYANTGTDLHVLICQRTGDYDFGLRGLVAIYYRFKDKPWLLYPQTKRKVLDVLLDKKGGKVETTFSLGICGRHPETENHVLMTEGSRYLTNQLVEQELRSRGTENPEYDNELNGMNRWMLTHLQQFFMHDFYEYNAHPYQAYTVMAIENLAEFAEDARVKLAAVMLLNYLDAKYAVSSDNTRRYVPFRRQPPYRTRTDLLAFDDESQRMVQMAGATDLFDELPTPWFWNEGEDRMLMAALGTYRTPALILDLMLNRAHSSWFQAFHHYGIEIYASSPSFLLSGGGVFVPVWDFFSDQMNGWALPTTLIPTRGGLDASQFIRFLGHKNDSDRANTCVAPGFACGLDPLVPASIPASCQHKQGAWTFFDFTAPDCGLQLGFYAALYSAPCDSGACKGAASSFGFLEAAEAAPGLDFGAFEAGVLAANSGATFRSDRDNEYVTTAGHRIRFRPLTHGKLDWSIRAIDGVATETEMARWPLAFGDVVRADGSGRVEISNPSLRKRLTLDMTDAMHPSRTESDY